MFKKILISVVFLIIAPLANAQTLSTSSIAQQIDLLRQKYSEDGLDYRVDVDPTVCQAIKNTGDSLGAYKCTVENHMNSLRPDVVDSFYRLGEYTNLKASTTDELKYERLVVLSNINRLTRFASSSANAEKIRQEYVLFKQNIRPEVVFLRKIQRMGFVNGTRNFLGTFYAELKRLDNEIALLKAAGKNVTSLENLSKGINSQLSQQVVALRYTENRILRITPDLGDSDKFERNRQRFAELTTEVFSVINAARDTIYPNIDLLSSRVNALKGQAANCAVGNVTILNNATRTLYFASSVPFGQTCQSEVVSCTNGVLSGTARQLNCAVQNATSTDTASIPVGMWQIPLWAYGKFGQPVSHFKKKMPWSANTIYPIGPAAGYLATATAMLEGLKENNMKVVLSLGLKGGPDAVLDDAGQFSFEKWKTQYDVTYCPEGVCYDFTKYVNNGVIQSVHLTEFTQIRPDTPRNAHDPKKEDLLKMTQYLKSKIPGVKTSIDMRMPCLLKPWGYTPQYFDIVMFQINVYAKNLPNEQINGCVERHTNLWSWIDYQISAIEELGFQYTLGTNPYLEDSLYEKKFVTNNNLANHLKFFTVKENKLGPAFVWRWFDTTIATTSNGVKTTWNVWNPSVNPGIDVAMRSFEDFTEKYPIITNMPANLVKGQTVTLTGRRLNTGLIPRTNKVGLVVQIFDYEYNLVKRVIIPTTTGTSAQFVVPTDLPNGKYKFRVMNGTYFSDTKIVNVVAN